MISLICGIQRNDTNELVYRNKNRPTDLENKFMVTRVIVGKRDSRGGGIEREERIN